MSVLKRFRSESKMQFYATAQKLRKDIMTLLLKDFGVRSKEMQENKKLKRYLVLQSFAPLFGLILIKHIGHFDLIKKFFICLPEQGLDTFSTAFQSAALGDVIISMVSIVWIVAAVIVGIAFRGFEKIKFEHHGEAIQIGSEREDTGVTFLVTFLLPLFVDDVSTLRGFIFFSVMLGMVIFLLMRSNLFCQNPVLVALGYKTFEFQFLTPYKDVKENKTYIGISYGFIPVEEAAIKRKYIADGVFIIYND